MNLTLEKEFSKVEIFERIDELKNQIDAVRPLPDEIAGKVMQKLRLDWNYNSNAIEGNKLSYGETNALLQHGVTAKGKPLKDHLDIQGHNAAIEFLMQMVQDGRPLTETDIRGLHEVILGEPHKIAAQTADGTPTTKMLTSGEYKKLPNHVKTRTGEIHYYATPEETPAKMNDLMQWYNAAIEDSSIHPIVIAALFHHRFVAIHPFDDGNGRMTRILMNLILMRHGYPVAVIKNDDKDNYYSLLSQADKRDFWPFVEYIAERVENSLSIYIKAINGQDIEDESDIDKELALFRMELRNNVDVKEKKTVENYKSILLNDIQPLLSSIVTKANDFTEFFFDYSMSLNLKTSGHHNHEVKYTNKSDMITNMINQIQKSTMIDGLIVRGKYYGFKNSKRNFDIACGFSVQFNIFDYVLTGPQSSFIIKKLYHEHLTQEDKVNFIKAFFSNLKNEITKELQKE
ncbi:Fic family protein [Mucilaginibacter sp. CSA2-8R]|uniref:Fic family protein n=1 Tax=Mucilaginibacter sp. CSA2-8R TaxID=3141542 RepID=UPI00315CB7DA